MSYNEDLTIEFTDIGGKAAIRPHWKNYYKDRDGVIFVVDAAETARHHECIKLLSDVMKEPKLPKGIPFMLLAHK